MQSDSQPLLCAQQEFWTWRVPSSLRLSGDFGALKLTPDGECRISLGLLGTFGTRFDLLGLLDNGWDQNFNFWGLLDGVLGSLLAFGNILGNSGRSFWTLELRVEGLWG